MAQIDSFIPLGGVYCEANSAWTADNITADAELVQLTLGVRIAKGSPVRGARVTISGGTVTPAVTPKSVTSFIWLEGQFIEFEVGKTYTFSDSAFVTFGKKVAI